MYYCVVRFVQVLRSSAIQRTPSTYTVQYAGNLALEGDVNTSNSRADELTVELGHARGRAEEATNSLKAAEADRLALEERYATMELALETARTSEEQHEEMQAALLEVQSQAEERVAAVRNDMQVRLSEEAQRRKGVEADARELRLELDGVLTERRELETKVSSSASNQEVLALLTVVSGRSPSSSPSPSPSPSR